MKTYQHAMSVAYALEWIKSQGWEGKITYDKNKGVFLIDSVVMAEKVSDGKREALMTEVIDAANGAGGLMNIDYDKDSNTYSVRANVVLTALGSLETERKIVLPDWEGYEEEYAS